MKLMIETSTESLKEAQKEIGNFIDQPRPRPIRWPQGFNPNALNLILVALGPLLEHYENSKKS